MSYSPLTMKRKHVLGDLYDRCDAVQSVPVYKNDEEGELLGHVDESLGHYADAFTFHLAEEICKRLSAGYYSYSFGYEFAESKAPATGKRRIRLTSICIVEGKPVAPVGPRHGNHAQIVEPS
jgi:hypothetical protein